MKQNYKITEILATIAARHDATPAQIALAWLLERKLFIVPIPGTTKIEHQRENMQAATIKLTADDMSELKNIKVSQLRGAKGVMDLIEEGAREETSSKGTHGRSPLPK